VTRYCVVWQDGWRIAMQTGTRKDVEPGSYRRVRDACREAARLNMALEATRSTETAEAA
jgi:hypothetical protein